MGGCCGNGVIGRSVFNGGGEEGGGRSSGAHGGLEFCLEERVVRVFQEVSRC